MLQSYDREVLKTPFLNAAELSSSAETDTLVGR